MDDDWLYLKVVNGTLVSYPYLHGLKTAYSYITYPVEHVNSFLDAYNIEPTYIDPNFVYGYIDEATGLWTGMLGHVCVVCHFIKGCVLSV